MLKRLAAAAVLILAHSQPLLDSIPVATRLDILSYTEAGSADSNDASAEAASRLLHSSLSAPAVLLGDWRSVEKCFASAADNWSYRLLGGPTALKTERIARQPVTLRATSNSVDFITNCGSNEFGLSIPCTPASDNNHCQSVPQIFTRETAVQLPLDGRSVTLLISKSKGGKFSLQLRFPDLLYGVGYRVRSLEQTSATELSPPTCTVESSVSQETSDLLRKLVAQTHEAVTRFRSQDVPPREEALKTANLLIHAGRALLPYYIIGTSDEALISQQEAKRELLQLAEEAKSFLFKLNDIDVPGSVNDATVFKLKSGNAELPISKDYLRPDEETVSETDLQAFPPVAPLEESICGVLVHYMGKDLRLSLGKTILGSPQISGSSEVTCVGQVTESYYWTTVPQSQPTEADAKRIIKVIIGFHQPHTVAALKQMIAAHYNSSDVLMNKMIQVLGVYDDSADPRPLFGVTKPKAIYRLR